MFIFQKRMLIVIILMLFFVASFRFTYAFWASSVEGSSSIGNGVVQVGTWAPSGFIGVTQTGTESGMITLDEIGTGSNTLSSKYILMTDIDLNNNAFTPIGGASGIFSGEFYGNGKKISNVSITTNQQYLGLFARNSGLISGVSLENINITLSSTTELIAGGIAGSNSGSIIFSYTTGSMNIETTYSGAVNPTTRTAIGGGIAGANSNKIENSHSSMTVSVTSNVNISSGGNRVGNAISKAGGLVGENTSATGILNNYATGAVSSTAIATAGGNSTGNATVYAGGLVGHNTTANGVNNSYATGSVTATGSGKTTNTMRFGGLNGLGAANSSYRMTGQSVTGNSGTANIIGTATALANLQSGTWIQTNLLWSADDWVFGTNVYPRLKRNKY